MEAARSARIAPLLLSAALVACAPQPVAPPPVAPAPAPADPPAPAPLPAQLFAETAPEYAFADPDRRRKLESGFAAVDALAEKALQEHGMPGLVIGVVVDGELAHARGFGVTDLETKAPPDADTVFRIGSVTKTFTATAVLALRDDGALSLDDPLSRWLPEAAGLVYPTRDAPPITLRQMLTHTSGLPRLGDFKYTSDAREPSEQEILQSLSGYSLASVPGTRHEYSNLGYALLGLVVGRAAHAPLRDFLAARLFRPLGMTSTAFDAAGFPAGRVASPYERDPKGTLKPAKLWRLGASEGAGGIYSTVRDMARYVAFQLAAYPPRDAPDTGPLRRSSVREAHFDALPSDRLSVEARPSPAKGEATVIAESSAWGFGWGRKETCEVDQVIWHNGAVDGYSAAVSFLPERGVGFVALSNRVLAPLSGLLGPILGAMIRTGGLAPRIRRPVLPPAFAPAMTRFLSLYNTWDERAYQALVVNRTPAQTEEERKELARYKSLHGACTGYSPIEVISPQMARLALRCERAALELFLHLQGDGVAGFEGTSRDLPPPPELARAAERLAGLTHKWDDRTYEALFGRRPAADRAEARAFAAKLDGKYGACAVKAFSRTLRTQDFAMACEHGDLRLTLALDATEKVARHLWKPVAGEEACPVRR